MIDPESQRKPLVDSKVPDYSDSDLDIRRASIRKSIETVGRDRSYSVGSEVPSAKKDDSCFATMALFIFFPVGVILILLTSLDPGIFGKCSEASSSSIIPIFPTVTPATFYTSLYAHGYKTNNIAGTSMLPTSGTGMLAINPVTQQVFASAESSEIFLDGVTNKVHVFDPRFGCTTYNGGQVYAASIELLPNKQQSFFNQYFCKWITPSPCSWASVTEFYGRLNFTNTANLGGTSSSLVDIFWAQFDIVVTDPIFGRFPKTTELHFVSPGQGSDSPSGFLTHLSHWSSNQSSSPIFQQYDIYHSNDDAFNSTSIIPESVFTTRSYWGNCTELPPLTSDLLKHAKTHSHTHENTKTLNEESTITQAQALDAEVRQKNSVKESRDKEYEEKEKPNKI